jgi:O-antigen/teichoic acid export membrane protein
VETRPDDGVPVNGAYQEGEAYSVRERGTRSLRVLLVGRGIGSFLLLVQSLALARILTPEDFGTFAVAALALAGFETVSETGITRALVQRNNVGRRHLDTAFTIQVARGMLLFTLIWLAADLIADYFNDASAGDVLRGLAVGILIHAGANVGLAVLEHRVDFDSIVRVEVLANTVSLPVAIGSALAGFGVWSFVAGYLAARLTRTALSYRISDYRPRMSIHRREATELFGYSRWLFAQSILLYLTLNIDDAIVGRTVGIAAVGLYSQAYRISQTPVTELAQVMGRVTLPTFARSSQANTPTGGPFLELLRGTMLLSIPMGVAITIVAPEFVEVVLGTQWLAMVPALQLLGGYAIVRSVHSIIGPVLNGLGRPDRVALLLSIRFVLVAALVLLLTEMYQITGTAGALLLAFGAASIPWMMVTARVLGIPAKEFGRALLPGATAGLLLTAALSVVTMVLPLSHLTALIVATLLFLALLVLIARHEHWPERLNLSFTLGRTRR